MLSVDEVTSQAFAKTRRGDGYDTGEVDTFRAEVAEALTARETVIDRLRDELDACQRELDAATGPQDVDVARREASGAAARLLEIATVNADQLVNDASAEAAALVSAAQAEADELLASSRAEVQRREAQIEDLRQLESEHRERLRRHFTEHLARLDDAATVVG